MPLLRPPFPLSPVTCNLSPSHQGAPLATRENTPRKRPRKPIAQRRAPDYQTGRPVDLGHHERRCCVCRHPDRLAIEEDFNHWRSPSEICIEYEISDRSSIYRHAHATGLFFSRKQNIRFALERIIECAEEAEVTGSAIVSAVRAYTRITDDGRWVNPPQHIHVSHDSPLHSHLPSLPPFDPSAPPSEGPK